MSVSTLLETDYKNVWDWVYNELSFKPSTRSIDWPSIQTSRNSIKFKIDFLWGSGYSELVYFNFIQHAIEVFMAITLPGEEVYALDWQHECFYFDPRKLNAQDMLDDGSSATKISFIPDGDYYIFITKDFENVWFGHPWERTITIIGDKLITSIKENGFFNK